MFAAVVLFGLVVVLFHKTEGHGMMLVPPGRSSVWRYHEGFPANYNDNELFCGGLQAMIANKGCGVCGDDLSSPRPRANENTGLYGTGTIVAVYESGQVIDTSVTLSANHLGHFQFSLCDNGDGTTPESGEECFQLLKLENGSERQDVVIEDYIVNSRVKLPDGVKCEHCVLRWHYKAANAWGICEDGSGGIGCGDQESFRSCADIKIV